MKKCERKLGVIRELAIGAGSTVSAKSIERTTLSLTEKMEEESRKVAWRN